jgi:hypothetical protein
MTRAELEHAIRAACDVADEREVFIFGSQSILGSHPDAPAALLRSIEVDVCPVHRADRIDAIDGNLGELSIFHDTHGFYVHGLSIEAATLPPGWRSRAIKVQSANTRDCIGWCLSASDLAVSKLVAFRDKDREFVRAMLAARLTTARALIRAIRTLGDRTVDHDRMVRWITATSGELTTQPRARRIKRR